jgi:hypothetical protein
MAGGGPVFTGNETNNARLYGAPNQSAYVKDAFHAHVVDGHADAVNPEKRGTKAAWVLVRDLDPGESVVVRLRLSPLSLALRRPFGASFDRTFQDRIAEADTYYGKRLPAHLPEEERRVARQSYAGLLWSKQLYHYVVESWLLGDPDQPPPPSVRLRGRNADWGHLFSRDVLSMPDKWEYPWFAAWDLAFHMIPMARIDPDFAKAQLLLLLREWYMHPNGQMPAYEFAFGDVNPPVHAWACWRVYKLTGPKGGRDRDFLTRCFQKLLLNFTWWVNRKDIDGKHLFSGGFLGLDNIGVFDRSRPLPTGGHLEQADGTAWMAFYCVTMLAMALELAKEDPTYEDLASKFFEHFVHITQAINTLGGTGLWNEDDGFYYDKLHVDGRTLPLRIRSLVGLVPLFTAEVLEPALFERLPGFAKRFRWFVEHRPELASHLTRMDTSEGPRWLLSIASRERLERVLDRLFDEGEFLSPFGVRSVSLRHRDEPYVLRVNGEEFRVAYTPGESNTSLFGGNSNWRGPIWFPMNYLIIEVLERYHYFYGDSLRIPCPERDGSSMDLRESAREISRRLVRMFLPDATGRRPCLGDGPWTTDPLWRDLVLFHEYFHPETGRGCGASHQTGWTALVSTLIESLA